MPERIVHSLYVYIDDPSKFLGWYLPKRGIGVDDPCIVDEKVGSAPMLGKFGSETSYGRIVGDVLCTKVSIIMRLE